MTVKMKRFLLLLALVVPAWMYAQVAPAPVQIPDTRVNIMDFGAVADGSALNTVAFEKAVSALQKQGGGHLVVPAGLYMTGPIVPAR